MDIQQFEKTIFCNLVSVTKNEQEDINGKSKGVEFTPSQLYEN